MESEQVAPVAIQESSSSKEVQAKWNHALRFVELADDESGLLRAEFLQLQSNFSQPEGDQRTELTHLMKLEETVLQRLPVDSARDVQAEARLAFADLMSVFSLEAKHQSPLPTALSAVRRFFIG